MNYDWYNVRAFRRPQHEVPATCASRLAQMLQGLEAIHPSLSRWFAAAEKHGDESVPADPISPAEEHLTRLFENGIYLHAAKSDGVAMLRAVATDGHRLARMELPLP